MIFKQIFRVAFIALIWKQYKALIVSTVLLVTYLLLVGSIHDDYLTHSQLQKDPSGSGASNGMSSGMSFVYKWAAYSLGVLLYFGFHAIRQPSSPQENLPERARQANKDAKHDLDDPFAAIREREKLRSRADFIEQDKKWNLVEATRKIERLETRIPATK